MQFNFIQKNDKKKIKMWWLILLCWLIIFRNYYIYQNNNLDIQKPSHLSQSLFKQQAISFQILKNILSFLTQLDCPSCHIKKIDISQHYLTIQGQAMNASDFLSVWKRLKNQDYLQKVDFLKWEKVGMHWNFSVKAFY